MESRSVVQSQKSRLSALDCGGGFLCHSKLHSSLIKPPVFPENLLMDKKPLQTKLQFSTTPIIKRTGCKQVNQHFCLLPQCRFAWEGQLLFCPYMTFASSLRLDYGQLPFHPNLNSPVCNTPQLQFHSVILSLYGSNFLILLHTHRTWNKLCCLGCKKWGRQKLMKTKGFIPHGFGNESHHPEMSKNQTIHNSSCRQRRTTQNNGEFGLLNEGKESASLFHCYV